MPATRPATPLSLRPADPDEAGARACLAAYAALLAARIPALGATDLPFPDPEAPRFRAPSGAFLLAEAADGAVMGCVAVKTVAPGLGEVKRLWTDPAARGLGLGRQLMAGIEAAALDLGLSRLRLDTNSALPEALALYDRLGWEPIAPFTDWPADVWRGKSIIAAGGTA